NGQRTLLSLLAGQKCRESSLEDERRLGACRCDQLGLKVVHLLVDGGVTGDEIGRVDSRPLPEFLADLDVRDPVAISEHVGRRRLARARWTRDENRHGWF